MIQQSASRQKAQHALDTFLDIALLIDRKRFDPMVARAWARYATELAETLSAYGAQEEGADHE